MNDGNVGEYSRHRHSEIARARNAYQAVKRVKDTLDSENLQQYAQQTRRAAGDIMTMGLGQTLAFWRAKAKKSEAYRQLSNDVSKWVLSELSLSGDENLLEWLMQKSDLETERKKYRRARVEVLAYLLWLKRFSEAELLNDMEQSNDEDE